jgi:threonine dehydrogenase-like Zn-dependent dehydrogenase
LGHEYAGEVIEIGKDVTGFKIGDKVAGFPHIGCGVCSTCQSGRPFFCTSVRFLAGGFGDYMAFPHQVAVRVPQSMSLADAALVEPLACGLRALRLADMRGGENILVLGAGSMAVAVVYWARQLGAQSIAVASRSSSKRDTLLALGADAFHSFEEDDPKALAQLGQPDIVAECVGKPGMLNKAIELVRTTGTVISLGMCMRAEPIVPAFCAFKEIRLHFPIAYSINEFIATARAFETGKVRPEVMVDEVVGLEDVPIVLEKMRAGAMRLKVQVSPSKEPLHAQA